MMILKRQVTLNRIKRHLQSVNKKVTNVNLKTYLLFITTYKVQYNIFIMKHTGGINKHVQFFYIQ